MKETYDMAMQTIIDIENFIKESNGIEGIHRDPTDKEIDAHIQFTHLKKITIDDLTRLVSVCQPNAILRDKVGLNVIVGSYRPPDGGHAIVVKLNSLLKEVNAAPPSEKSHLKYQCHLKYESIHPFTDGNGRSGRALWAWMNKREKGYVPSEFLRPWYYSSLENG